MLLALIILMLTAGAGGQAVSIVAEVNGAPITRQRFQVDYRQAVNDYARKGNPINEAYLRNLRARLIDYLVETELLLQDARRKGVAVTDQELDRILAAERSTARGEAEISAGLEAVGLDWDQYRERRRQALVIEKLIREHIARHVVIRDQDVEKYYAQNPQEFRIPERLHIRHITLRFPPDADESQKAAVRDRLLDIERRYSAGGDFAELAYRYSDDPSRQNSGDAGFVDARLAAQTFGERVLEIPTGEVGPPLETPIGWHLVAIEGRQPARDIPLDQVREVIRKTLFRQQTSAPVKDYVQSLREKATIVVYE
jgi:parvulin-like peptidyl-prolyl isomerase